WLFGIIWALRGVQKSQHHVPEGPRRNPLSPRKLWASPLLRILVTVILMFVAGLLIYDVPIFHSDETLESAYFNHTKMPSQKLSVGGLSEDSARLTYFILDLALQPLGDWRGFNSLDQFGQSALRYKLAFMTYALAQVHYLQLPAYPTPFQEAIDRLIQRMMQKRVWSYWYFENLWGNWKKNPDPVYEMNVMYSGHLANMIGLYEWLFNDHKYDEPGSIRLVWDEDTAFEYDHASLVERLYSQMHDNPYHSIACEPQQVFAMCNDHAALSLMLFDATHNTQLSDVNHSYIENLDHLFHGDDGFFNYPYYYHLDVTLPLHLGVGDGWALALMHPFARQRVRSMYPAFFHRHGRWQDDSTATVTGHVFEFMDIGDYRLSDASQVSFGLLLASEVGDTTFAKGLWRHAVRKYQPINKDGTMYFSRASLLVNSVFLLGRVNQPDGLWRLYNQGWPTSHFHDPHLKDLNLNQVLVLRADYAPESGLTFVLKPRHQRTTQIEVNITDLQPDVEYTLRQDSQLVKSFQTPNGNYTFTAKISDKTQFEVKSNFSISNSKYQTTLACKKTKI
ncbi:MAG: hypothetical protein ACE5NG_12170, partial [bacterium]